MKYLLLILLLSSCASKERYSLPVFDKKKDCSAQTLEYYKEIPNRKKTTDAQTKIIRDFFKDVSPEVKKCYQSELDKEPVKSVNLCFAMGVNKTGNIDYFSFSAERTKISNEMMNCLSKLRKSTKFESLPFKDVRILQPFHLFPRRY